MFAQTNLLWFIECQQVSSPYYTATCMSYAQIAISPQSSESNLIFMPTLSFSTGQSSEPKYLAYLSLTTQCSTFQSIFACLVHYVYTRNVLVILTYTYMPNQSAISWQSSKCPISLLCLPSYIRLILSNRTYRENCIACWLKTVVAGLKQDNYALKILYNVQYNYYLQCNDHVLTLQPATSR